MTLRLTLLLALLCAGCHVSSDEYGSCAKSCSGSFEAFAASTLFGDFVSCECSAPAPEVTP